MVAAMAVLRNIKRPIVMQQSKDIVARWAVDYRGRDDLVHGLVILRPCWVVYKTRTATVDSAREEGYSQRLVVSDAL